MNSSIMCFHRTGAPLALGEVISSFVVVHEDHAGFVIGYNGATVKHIGSKTNTWIHVQPPNEFSMGHPWFVIKGGTQDDVAAAYHQMRGVLQEAEMKMPRWSVGITMTSEDYDRCEAYLSDPIKEEERLCDQIHDCYEFNAALTDFAFKDTETWALNEEIAFFESMSDDTIVAFYETHNVDETDRRRVDAYFGDDIANEINYIGTMDECYEFDAALTDFERKIYDKEMEHKVKSEHGYHYKMFDAPWLQEKSASSHSPSSGWMF